MQKVRSERVHTEKSEHRLNPPDQVTLGAVHKIRCQKL